MTIHHINGTQTEAIILSNHEGRLRVAIEGWEDVAEVASLHGQWLLNDIEPVHVTFAWESQGKREAVSLDDCICSPKLGSSLIRLLNADSESDVEVEMRPMLVLSAGASFC